MKIILTILPGGLLLLALWQAWRYRDDIALMWAMWQDRRAGHDLDEIERNEGERR